MQFYSLKKFKQENDSAPIRELRITHKQHEIRLIVEVLVCAFYLPKNMAM